MTSELGDLARRGAVTAPRPRRAAEHFYALTLLVVVNRARATALTTAEIADILADGVDAFLRAYAGRRS